jgi:hypothetical protein
MSPVVKQLQAKLERAKADEEARNAMRQFKCACGKMHAIKACVVIQTHWYTPPHGCCEGDYWNVGELRIICPITQIRNRVLFATRTEVPWRERHNRKFNPEIQFADRFKHLFKEVLDDYYDDTGATFNNDYFDQNHAKFGIKIASSPAPHQCRESGCYGSSASK